MALTAGHSFSRALHTDYNVNPHFVPVKLFPTLRQKYNFLLFYSYTFSRALHRVQLPALSTVTLFLTEYNFPRFQQLHFFPRFAPSTISRAFNSYTFSYRVQFPTLSTITLFPALCTGCNLLAMAYTGLRQFHFIYF